jgi:chromosome segregation ATPase
MSDQLNALEAKINLIVEVLRGNQDNNTEILASLSTIDSRLHAIEIRLGSIEDRLAKLESRVANIEKNMDKHKNKILELEKL